MSSEAGRGSSNSSLHVFLVEDHPSMREMLITFLEISPGIEICGSAESAEKALAYLKDVKPDLLLVDVSLPGMNGIDLVSHVRSSHPDLPCLMLSGHGENSYVKRALRVGARGYVLKDDSGDLPRAIRAVKDGKIYLSRSIRGRVPNLPSDVRTS